jgi:syringate O-demethylase
MTAKNLEELLGGVGNIAAFLRNQQVGPNVYPGVPAEYSNWRDEQRAWQETCVLYNQSYHMADLEVTGPDALKLLTYLGVNSTKGFTVNKAKQFVPCTYDGYVIGDVILFYLGENHFNLVGRAPTLNWVRYHAETGGYDVKAVMDERTARRSDGRRKSYRFQIQGPNAMKVMEKVLGETPPDLKFFNMTMVTIAGRQVHALRHGMAGQPGFELFGPWDDGEPVRQALIAAGEEFGLRLVGGRAYSSNTLESGWIPSPLPAIYTGDARMKAYREWLPADSYEGICSLGGSYYSDNIEDYYLTPWDLGYGFFVKFDHDFIGREALEKMAAAPKRHKVTLALDSEDVMRVMSSMFHKGGDRAKAIEFPSAVYAMHPFDKVLADGKMVGVSTWVGYSSNEGKMLTLAIVDEAYAKPGTKISLLWGEENGGSRKPTVERHVQTEISGIVAPMPYAEVARDAYADSWRNRKA